MSDSTVTAPTQADLDALRSSSDKRIAKTQKERDALANQMAQLQQELAALKSSSTNDVRLAQIQAELNRLDAIEDPATALAQAKQIALQATQAALTLDRIRSEIDGKHHKAAAQAASLRLAQEYGGKAERYQERLMNVSSEQQFESEVKLIAAERMQKTARKEAKTASKTAAGQAPASGRNPARSVDRGAGSAVRGDLVAEMNAIDVTTPEGRKQWAEKEREFKAKIAASHT